MIFFFPREHSIPVKIAIMPSFFVLLKDFNFKGRLFIDNKAIFIIEMIFTIVLKFICNNRCCRENSQMKLGDRLQ